MTVERLQEYDESDLEGYRASKRGERPSRGALPGPAARSGGATSEPVPGFLVINFSTRGFLVFRKGTGNRRMAVTSTFNRKKAQYA
ncbi:hypothetical protein EV190_103198 [Actinorugispora endophytica]|uniref:Uncharacterized protein n=1 Tax=Actinorugispora endophytica TaxID=1605990 RepID=A0A4R6VAS8_9ACTN|nr:hypothetical protein EV190_103198 [Actinorugispora endophytica]